MTRPYSRRSFLETSLTPEPRSPGAPFLVRPLREKWGHIRLESPAFRWPTIMST